MTTIKTKLRPLAGALVGGLATLSLGLATQNAVAGSGEAKTFTVSYADLDLSKPAGAKTLYSRIRRAARTVCSPFDSVRMRRAFRDCYGQAITNAVAEVNRPTLAALHAEKGKRTARG